MSTEQGNAELFVLPHPNAGQWILYAPLAGRVVHANAGCVEQIRRYVETGDASLVDPVITSRLGGLDWLVPRRAPSPRKAEDPFQPTHLTLFLTNRCNLNCRYCYAAAGEAPSSQIADETAAVAIDVATENASTLGRPLSVGFHGGGEPTHAWSTLRRAVEYARAAAARKNVELRLGIATNGVMAPERRRFVAAEFPTVTLSMDGPSLLHDEQRPRSDGSGSFDDVMLFVEELHRAQTPFVVRTTVTARSVDRLPELVDFFADSVGCELIHFEPAFAAGRACSGYQLLPSPTAFASGFVAAVDRAAERGLRVRYSAARLGAVFAAFCACAGDPFNITPEGDLTACFEACDRDAAHAETFLFGRVDHNRRSIVLDHERLAHLRTLTVHHRPECRDCFARWSCAGDCPAKWEGGGPDPERCTMHRHIARALLERALDPKRCAVV